MQDRINDRTFINLNDFPLKVEFTLEDGTIIFGKVFDISQYGLCILASNCDSKLTNNIKGKLKIWKVEDCIVFPAEIRWVKNSFIGFGVQTSLIKTKLKQYIQ
jgi:hypothetical protein